MWKKFSSVIGSTVACAMVLGQTGAASSAGAVGSTAGVRGLVTVSDGSSVRTAREGAPVANGSRIVTSSNGAVTIRLENACVFNLQPNQSVEINSGVDCPRQISMIETLSSDTPLAYVPNSRDLALGALSAAMVAIILSGGKSGPGNAPPPGGPGNPDIDVPPVSQQ